MSTNKSSESKDSSKSAHGGPRKGAGRKPGRSFVSRAIAVRPADLVAWSRMSEVEGISLSQWIRERCGDVSGLGLVRMHERLMALVADRGGDPGEEFAEWRQLAEGWLEAGRGQTKEVKARLAGLAELVGK